MLPVYVYKYQAHKLKADLVGREAGLQQHDFQLVQQLGNMHQACIACKVNHHLQRLRPASTLLIRPSISITQSHSHATPLHCKQTKHNLVMREYEQMLMPTH